MQLWRERQWQRRRPPASPEQAIPQHGQQAPLIAAARSYTRLSGSPASRLNVPVGVRPLRYYVGGMRKGEAHAWTADEEQLNLRLRKQDTRAP